MAHTTRPATPNPNSFYQSVRYELLRSKTIEELRFVVRDAQQAEANMADINPERSLFYRDEWMEALNEIKRREAKKGGRK